MLAPDRAWDMYANDIKLGVFHNFKMDEKKTAHVGGFRKCWTHNGKKRFPRAFKKCRIDNGDL
jgi:hypothetical protein